MIMCCTNIEPWCTAMDALAQPDVKHWIVLPSLHPRGESAELLYKIPGIQFYEERQLYYALLLGVRSDVTLTFLAGYEIDPVVIDYYIELAARRASKGTWCVYHALQHA